MLKKLALFAMVAVALFFAAAHSVLAADGSGTNTVSPTSTTISSTGKTFTFTFTAAEAMNSGGFDVVVPAGGWSAPQGTNGVAGFTTASSTSGIMANIEDNLDSAANWTAQSGACNSGFSADLSVFHEGTASLSCKNSAATNNTKFFRNLSIAENWSGYTNVAFWIHTTSTLNSGQLKFLYSATTSLATTIASINLPAVTANTWTYVNLTLSGTRTSVLSIGFQIAGASAQTNKINIDDILLGPGTPSFPGGGVVRTRFLSFPTSTTASIVYGSGGGASGVTTPAVGGVYAFTTQSRISDSGTLTNIASSPTVTINNPSPTLTSISPTSTTAGSTGFTLTLTGTNFNASSSARWNGLARTTTFVSSSSITAAILTSDLTTPTTTSVTVVNPVPGGGTSTAQTFTVNKASTSIAVMSSATSSVYGNSVTFTATVTPAAGGPPTGTVTFKDGAATLGTGTLNGANPGVATFATTTLNVLGSPHAITAVYGGDSNFLGSTSGAISETITTKTLTITGITASNKVYDASTTATLSGTPGTLVGVVAGDTVSLAGTAVGTFATSSVGNGITVAVSGQSLTGAQASNYSLTEPTTTANITAKNLTVTGVTANDKVYDRTTSSTLNTGSVSLVGVIVGDVVTLNTGGAAGTFATSSVGSGIMVTVSGITISGAQSANYTLTEPTTTANITTKTLTITGITANNKVYDASTTATLAGTPGTLIGVIAPDAVSLTGTAIGTFTTSSAGSGIVVTVSGQSLTGAQASNYSLTEPATAANITAKGLTVTGITANNKVYDRTTSSTVNVGSASLVGVISGDTVVLNTASAVGTFATSSAGAGITVTVSGLTISGAQSANYTLTQPTTTATITAKNLTVTGVTANDKTFDGNTTEILNTGSAALVGVVSGDIVTLNTTGATGTFATSSVGTGILVTVSSLTIDGASSGNYTLTQPTTTASITNPNPTTISISPTSTTAGSAQFTLTVNGTNFVTGSVVDWNGSPRTTSFISANQLTATIPATDVAKAGTASVTVINSAPGGGTSNSQTFTVLSSTPVLNALSPTSTTAGGAQFTLTLNGSNFFASSTADWNGSPLVTAFVSASQLTAIVPATDIAVAGIASVTVVTPAPGGGTSGAQTFTINNPVPTTTSLSPTSTTAGSAQFTLTVNGTNFVASSVVNWNGSPRTTSFVSANQITATIPTTDVVATGTAAVTVVNATPGGGTSNAQTFTIATPPNPIPILTALSPTSTTAGSGGFTLTLTGTGFISTSQVQWNGGNRTTTFVSSSSLTAAILASDVSTAGTFAVMVVNPAPGGGTSASQTFTVLNPVPTTTSLSPTSTTAGSAQFTLTVNGTNFVASSIVNWNGSPRTTSFVSANQLTATIPSSDVVATGTASITVVNAVPGGGTSNAQTFTINEAASKFVIVDPGAGTVGIPKVITIQAEDTNNQLAATFSGGVTLVASGTSITGGGLVNLVNGVGTTTISTNIVQTVALSLSDTQATGFDVSSARSVTFIAGSTAALTLNHPGSISTGARAAYVVSRTDQFNNPTTGSSTVVYLYASSASTTSAFFNAASGGTQIASTTIGGGATSTQFWYYDTAPGTFTITASDNPTAPDGATGLADATDNLTVVAGAVKFIFANVTSTAIVGNTATFNVEAVDSFNVIDASYNQSVTVTKTGSGSGAPTGGGVVTIINGIGTSTVSDTLAETVNLALQDTQSTGLNVSSTASIAFLAGPIAKFSLNHPGNMNTGVRLGYVLGSQDQFGNPTLGSSTIVYLYSNSTSPTAAFFDTSNGGNQIASTTIGAGSTSTQFWYYDTVPGTFTITASDNPTAPDGAAGLADATDNLTVAPGAVRFVFANVTSTATAGDTITFNVEAVDSFGTIDPSSSQSVTVTKTGSANGGGLVTMVNGMATTTITDNTAESITLGLQDTGSTGLGVTDTRTITFAAIPAPVPSFPGPEASTAAEGTSVPMIRIKPGVNVTFSGWAYPGASVSLIRKDLGLAQAPLLQSVTAAADGSFLVKLNNVTRLTGQTYLLGFADKNGVISETKAYNIPVGKENLVNDKMVIAPTVGFSGDSIVSKGGSVIVQGYAAPKGTVALFVDGKTVGTITVNDPSGQYRYVLDTTGLATGRHSVAAVQTVNTIQSDSSSQQSFTVSPLANPKLDLNGDGVVDVKDISIYLSYLKNLGAGVISFNTTDPNLLRVLDLNGDGQLNVQDLSILLHAAGVQ